MTRLEIDKKEHWEAMGIDTLLELFRCGQPYSSSMLLDALHFWEGSTNTFHTRCGMITPTLLDVTAIIGLKPNGKFFNHTEADPLPIRFNVGKSRSPTYNNFIDHHKQESGSITDEEHVTFLTL